MSMHANKIRLKKKESNRASLKNDIKWGNCRRINALRRRFADCLLSSFLTFTLLLLPFTFACTLFYFEIFCGYFRIPKPKRESCLWGELYFTHFYKNISWWGFVYIAFKLFHIISLVHPSCECEKCESKSLANMDDMFNQNHITFI